MAISKAMPMFFFFFIFSELYISSMGSLNLKSNNNEDTKVYIVYMGSKPTEYTLSSDHHLSILQSVVEGRTTAEKSLVRSYTRSFNGFAAKLTDQEMKNLKNMKEVVSVFPSKTLQLQTTRSWDFMGFPMDAPVELSTAESNITVGVLDTGIWPDSPSFSDDGFGPPPKKWKGVCKGGQNFTCNNKIIGARMYTGGSAFDEVGHGSHTASTAAGNIVANASFYGIAEGNARGGAPFARIAMYSVCFIAGCAESDILAGFDDAIADGVDLITISIGYIEPVPFYEDVIAVGAFHAMAKGILTVQSAGNERVRASIISVAPWLFTVGASTMDRQILTNVSLGNGKTLVGLSVNSFTLKGDKFPLVYGQGASTECPEEKAKLCEEKCLDSTLVKGKIVVCDSIKGIAEAFSAGALGSVLLSDVDDVSFVLPLPAVALRKHEHEALHSYLNSTKTPEANIFKSDCINDTTAPKVASFSSKGPNKIASDILKPDVTAPGVDILAAYPPVVSPSGYQGDNRSVKYNVLSGTSMSCPHVAGAAAFLKSLNPHWSPAAIKSALMTTAFPMSPSKNQGGEFAFGSGHIDPVMATNPGLVYDADKDDYIQFLCRLGYDDKHIRLISGDKRSSCSKKIDAKLSPKDVNYPSMSAMVKKGVSFSIKFHRTVTNVGLPNSTYEATVTSDSRITVTVEPSSLFFKSLNEQKSFDVTVVGEGISSDLPVSASLVWSDGTCSVRSPIVMYTNTSSTAL